MELRFEGSEELGYDPLGTPPKGEICLRGPLIFQGYFQDKKKTTEAFGAPLLHCLLHLARNVPPSRTRFQGPMLSKAGEAPCVPSLRLPMLEPRV